MLLILAAVANVFHYDSVVTAMLLLFVLVASVAIGIGAFIITSTNADTMELFMSENKIILQKYFLDFIKAKMPEQDKTYTTNFRMETIVDNGDVSSRAVKMTGICIFKNKSAEMSVTLRFNPSHSKMEVQTYDIVKIER